MIDRPLDNVFSVELCGADDHVRVVVRGELDLASAPEAVAAFGEARRGGARVDVDLSGVTFMDSSGLQALVAARKDADRHRVALTVVAASDVVDRLLALTQTGDWLRGS